MSKNIIICLDGTWDKPDEKPHEENEETNVRNLYELLEKDEPHKQVVYYDTGVGSHWYDRIRGGVSGRGLSKNIREAYYEICRHYEEGDKVCVFGFSRGAYTARSLTGLIYSCGLIRKDALTDESIAEAFDVYKKADKPTRQAYKDKNVRCKIEIIGVWDTVGALGIPISFFKKYTNKFLQFHDTKINKEINRAYHALSIDEQRETFRPTLWNVRAGNSHQTIDQVWFAGVHSDVGGGYMQREHSDITFKWMIDKIKDVILLDDTTYPYHADISSDIHDSYKFYYGGKERRVASATDVNTPCVHESVLQKLQGNVSYKPLALVDIEDKTTLAPYEVVS